MRLDDHHHPTLLKSRHDAYILGFLSLTIVFLHVLILVLWRRPKIKDLVLLEDIWLKCLYLVIVLMWIVIFQIYQETYVYLDFQTYFPHYYTLEQLWTLKFCFTKYFKNNTCDGCFKFGVRESIIGTEPNRYRVYSFEMLLGTFKMSKMGFDTMVLGTKKRGKVMDRTKTFYHLWTTTTLSYELDMSCVIFELTYLSYELRMSWADILPFIFFFVLAAI